MSEANTKTTHRVHVRNHAEAPQGVYEAKAPPAPGAPVDIIGGGEPATYIKPGESRVITVDDETLKHLKAHPAIFSVTAATDAAEAPAPAAAVAPEKAAAPTEDQFDTMSDEELRAFVTDRGQRPHNFAGRAKLLIMARGPADAPDPQETV